MGTLRALVRATHPIPAISVTLMVAGLVAFLGGSGGVVAWTLAATAAGQASVGWSNDVLDRERDAAAGRTEKPLAVGAISPRLVAGLALAALVASPLLALPLGAAPAVVMAVALAAAWLYNLGLKATPLSWVPYAVAFGLVPAFAWPVVGRGWPPGWIVGATALLGVAAHLMNVIPDLGVDRDAGGLPHRLGRSRSLLAAAGLLVGVLALAVAEGGGTTPAGIIAAAVAAGLVAAAAVAVLRDRPRLGFHLTIAAAAAIGLVVVLAGA